MTGEDRPGEVVKPLAAAVTEVALTVWLGIVTPVFDDRLGRAKGAFDQVGPTHVSNGLEALGIVDKVADVDHRSVL